MQAAVNDPACWSWLVTDDHRFAASRCPENFSHYLLWNWQQGRCAVCADLVNERSILVRDHDHQTGLMRGLLCQVCNNAEGRTACGASERSDLFDNYRATNPASTLKLRARHVITSGPFGLPLPRRHIGNLHIPLRRPAGEQPSAHLNMPAMTAYGSWADITGRGKQVEHPVFDLVGLRFNGYDIVRLTVAYRREVIKALPEGISLHGINFFGPYPQPDNATERIKAAIDAIDLDLLASTTHRSA